MCVQHIYWPMVKFQYLEESVLHAIQTDKDAIEDRTLDSDSEDEGINEDDLDMPPPPAIVFEIDPNIDITSQALWDMVSIWGGSSTMLHPITLT